MDQHKTETYRIPLVGARHGESWYWRCICGASTRSGLATGGLVPAISFATKQGADAAASDHVDGTTGQPTCGYCGLPAVIESGRWQHGDAPAGWEPPQSGGPGDMVTRGHIPGGPLNAADVVEKPVDTYRIVRFYQRGGPMGVERETVKEGLTFAEAQDHCNDPETSSKTGTGPTARDITSLWSDWFDGYEQEVTE